MTPTRAWPGAACRDGAATYADVVRVREPVARPLDIVAVELLLSAAQAFLAGVLLYLAAGFWEDRGVGLSSAAAVVLLMGLAVGGGWLYWLLGGVGWPMAAANAAAAMFVVALLLLTWFGQSFRVGGAPLLLAAAAAVFGVAAGAFLDSPRRWRWDQRARLRPGTSVPRVSATTQALVAQMPRSLPRRRPPAEPVSELAVRIGSTSSAASAPAEVAQAPRTPGPDAPAASSPAGDERETEPEQELNDAPRVEGVPLSVPEAPEPVLPTTRSGRASAAVGSGQQREHTGEIELPTMIEPKAQRSPWAWAAPPEWNRDEDDEPAARSSGRK